MEILYVAPIPQAAPPHFQISLTYNFRENIFDGTLCSVEAAKRIKDIFLEEIERRRKTWHEYGIVGIEEVEGSETDVRLLLEYDNFFKRQFFRMVAFDNNFSERVEREVTRKRYRSERTAPEDFKHPSYYRAVFLANYDVPRNKMFLSVRDPPATREEIINMLPNELRSKVVELYKSPTEHVFDESGREILKMPFSSDPFEGDTLEPKTHHTEVIIELDLIGARERKFIFPNNMKPL